VTDIRQDVGQLLWFGFPGTELDPATRARIAAGRMGAAILYRRNVAQGDGGDDLAAVAALNASLHQAAADAAAPLLIAVDQEGGRVQRVRSPGTVWPPMLELDGFDRARAATLAAQLGEGIGRELCALGFDVDFAPVLDVQTNADNPIIGDRAFATEPERVAELALAFARGLDTAGVMACGKHFPGHGDTHTDSHLELPRLSHSLERLENVELVPFRRAAKAGVPLVMTAHIVFDAIDPDRPATLSRAVITDLLRERLGFAGLVLSDDMDMNAIADHYGAGDAAVAAIEAGCDGVLACNDVASQHDMFETLVRTAETNPAFRARVGESAAAVRRVKESYAARQRTAPGLDVVGCAEHVALARRIVEGERGVG